MGPISKVLCAPAVGLVVACGGATGPDYGPLSVSTSTLAVAVLGVPYTASLAAEGGDGFYRWSLADGRLPAGLELNPFVGEISGVPTTEESQDFTVEVTTGDGQTAHRELDINVVVPPVLQPEERCSEYPAYAYATFEDANLAATIREALQLSPEQNPTCASLKGLGGELDGRDRDIGSLSGLQNLSSLTGLGLDFNRIADISPLAGLTGLHMLRLSYNDIQDISALETLSELDTLMAARNYISDLSPLSGLTSLRFLGVPNNPIRDVSALGALENLTLLVLSWTDVSDLEALSGLVGLQYLEAIETQITDLGPLSGLTALETLAIERNDLHDLTPLGGLSALRELYIMDCGLSNLSGLGALEGLSTLWAADNEISDIGALAGTRGLVNLQLERSSITDLSALGGLPDLYKLNLLGNLELSDIQPLLENPGLGAGDVVNLAATRVACEDVAALQAKGVQVSSRCSS